MGRRRDPLWQEIAQAADRMNGIEEQRQANRLEDRISDTPAFPNRPPKKCRPTATFGDGPKWVLHPGVPDELALPAGALEVRCPNCAAPKGQRCYDSHWYVSRKTHLERVLMAPRGLTENPNETQRESQS